MMVPFTLFEYPNHFMVHLDSFPFSSMSSITNDEDGLLVGDHSEPSLEDGFSSHESIRSKDG